MTLRRCQVCAYFYDKREPCCPKCDTAPHPPNKYLITAKLNSHMHSMAESAAS